jgi:hypothetical protein
VLVGPVRRGTDLPPDRASLAHTVTGAEDLRNGALPTAGTPVPIVSRVAFTAGGPVGP